MMSRTFGAPFGGTMRGGHQVLESLALSLITPPNFGGGGGSCWPLIVVVALGEPRSPVTCCAAAGAAARMPRPRTVAHALPLVFIVSLLEWGESNHTRRGVRSEILGLPDRDQIGKNPEPPLDVARAPSCRSAWESSRVEVVALRHVLAIVALRSGQAEERLLRRPGCSVLAHGPPLALRQVGVPAFSVARALAVLFEAEALRVEVRVHHAGPWMSFRVRDFRSREPG